MEKRHRIFIAINLPEDIKRELAKYEQKWPELPARWTNKNQLHITLEFLGDLTGQELAEVCKVANEVARRHKSFSVSLGKVCYGGRSEAKPTFLEVGLASPQVPRMVWVEGEKSDNLKDLKEDLVECLKKEMRFRPEGRQGFTPHITLARINEWQFKSIEPEERPEINEDIDLTFSVESIEVMESELKRGGPVYTILESCELKI